MENLLVERLEGILLMRVSSHHASLWLPTFRTIQLWGCYSMNVKRLEYHKHRSFRYHRNHRFRMQTLRLLF